MLPPDISPQKFLSGYWQKQPLLIKNALPNFQDPISPEELAGLACEEEVESRLVFNEKDTWRLQNGPFTEQAFTSLSNDNWSLLIQAVDQWFPEVKKLLTKIDFIPDWRLDDVMVSYATENAGIGPHFDYYDVIIIQGKGQRQWQIGQHCDESSPSRSDSELKILKEFNQTDEFILETGDALYIPPGIAHQGTALNDSLSYSIGFRAPSYTEIISQYAGNICNDLAEDQRYSDPDIALQKHSAEISPASINRLKSLLLETLHDEQKIEQWFGRHMTQRLYPELAYYLEPQLELQDFITALSKGMILEKHTAARFAFQHKADSFTLFADGEAFLIDPNNKATKKLAHEICDKNINLFNCSSYLSNNDCLLLLCKLYNLGSFIDSEATN